jgi:hypothetical protein
MVEAERIAGIRPEFRDRDALTAVLGDERWNAC